MLAVEHAVLWTQRLIVADRLTREIFAYGAGMQL